MMRLVVGLLAVLLGWAGFAARIEAQLTGVDVHLTQVADSGSYFVYSYSLGNPATSTWGMWVVTLDINATSGTPATLPATGDLLDATSSPRIRPHAEVGPITPAGWEAGLSVDATLEWYPPFNGMTSEDSIAPGETRMGYGIRSSYLPGIQDVTAQPTVESCCQEPLPDGDFYPPPSSFSVTGTAVVPRYMPSEVTIDVVRDQAESICEIPFGSAIRVSA